MEEIKRFDIEKANELLLIYRKKRQFRKANFLVELISFQNFFGNKSIIDCFLLLSRSYKKKIIESVLFDLGYSLVYFEHSKLFDHTRIKFK